jgi:hypothetical protein
MKALVMAALAALLFVAGGCKAETAGATPIPLDSAACPSLSTKTMKEKLAKAIADYGLGHCRDLLEAQSPRYVDTPFGENGQAVSNFGCLIKGGVAHERLVPGTKNCFVLVRQSGPIFAAMHPKGQYGQIVEGAKPPFFIIAESGNDYFWIYARKGSVCGESVCVVRTRAKPKGDLFVEVVYLPLSDGKWERWTRGLNVRTDVLTGYAKDFRAFLTPHVTVN